MIAAAPLDPERTAILMIASPGAPFHGVPDAPALDRAAALLAHARATGAHVVHVRHLPGAAPGAGEAATALAGEPPEVAPTGWESVLDSPHPDPFAGTGLAEVLGARGVQAVVVAGPMSLACCDAAASQSLSRHFRTVVADDATDACEEGAVERGRRLAARTRAGVEVLSAEAIGTLLDAPAS
ncbi:isochorismatase family protein [Miltoncostaea oceani]|uniref:isochorismatase family protein n=1 Tax=Miltoncostaea oceani TaxID=2843216 RepID=UPI001C3D628C|nr:isochorismatase family protein [Miltoncostaea oceani]